MKEMKKDLTEMVFILDKSGSMSGLEADTIGGFNSMIEKQRKLDGQAKISTVLFNHQVNVLHDRVDIQKINNLTLHDYEVSGMTALLDALGHSITKIRHAYADTLREDRPSKVVFVITTDGMENASKEYTYKDIKNLIEKSKKDYDWEFIFLGANIDAIDEARKFGINPDFAANYHSDKEGTKKNYDAIDEAITSLRLNKAIKRSWKKDIEEDYKNR
jgi:uncharacterized protein YegL